MTTRKTCRWCDEYVLENNPGDYYHEKACERRLIVLELEKETDPKKIERLERRLWHASYTGD